MFHRRTVRGGILAACCIVALCVAAARATSVRPMPVGELAGRSTLIVAGTVAAESPRLAAGVDGNSRIFTDYDLRALVAGRGGVETRNHIVSLPGGSLHGRRQAVAGMPRLEKGRRYVLLLDTREPLCPILGWERGVFPVLPDGSGTPRVHLPDGRPVGAIAGGEVVPGGVGMTEGEFLRALARAAAESGFQPRAGGDDR